jgi:hypothetical protein
VDRQFHSGTRRGEVSRERHEKSLGSTDNILSREKRVVRKSSERSHVDVTLKLLKSGIASMSSA